MQRQSDTADLRAEGQDRDDQRAGEVGSATRGSRRSRTRSNTGRPLTAVTRPHISAYAQIPTTADGEGPGVGEAEPGAGLSVGNDVADVDEPADRGQHAQGDRQDPLHGLPSCGGRAW
ncbi:hypothetical protein A6A27_04895 [Micromonospora sp. CB01531]|nr:hypothetical protein A6A27_04895 [Micromonospora sp. CB01531]